MIHEAPRVTLDDPVVFVQNVARAVVEPARAAAKGHELQERVEREVRARRFQVPADAACVGRVAEEGQNPSGTWNACWPRGSSGSPGSRASKSRPGCRRQTATRSAAAS